MKNIFLLLTGLVILIAQVSAQASCTANTFQVTGNGVISIVPDIVSFSITATGNGATASAALNNLNTQINAILSTFNSFSIPSTNYSTSGININQIFNYS